MKTGKQLQKIARCMVAAQTKANDPIWQIANKKGAERRSKDPEWIKNNLAAVRSNTKNPIWIENQKAAIRRVSKTEKWKENQKNGCNTIRANNPNWRKNISKGHALLASDPAYIQQRKEVAAFIEGNPDFCDAVKKGCEGRWDKEENLTTCPHCGSKVDNANYTRHHGDVCWLKGKIIASYINNKKEATYSTYADLADAGFFLMRVKECVRTPRKKNAGRTWKLLKK
jgi:hypothetical protein